MKTFTIEQIRKYIESQDSLGDVLYNLSEANIDKANEEQPKLEDLRTLINCEFYKTECCNCINKCEDSGNDLPIDYLETF